MKTMLKKAFPFLWRITVFTLPFQTRWMFSDGQLGAFSWEQGTIAFFASWIPLMLTCVVSLSCYGANWRRGIFRLWEWRWLLGAAIIPLVLSSVGSASLSATGMWWLRGLFFLLFIATFMASEVSRRSFIVAFVVSMIPHAFLGLIQFAEQNVFGSVILGIAPHQSIASGTSVVEHGLFRVLRSYGGFPHPNIFAGWLVIALLALFDLIRTVRTKIEVIVWSVIGGAFILTLVCTFSRGAWVAFALAFPLAFIFSWKKSASVLSKQALGVLVVSLSIALFGGVWSQWDHVRARFQSSHRLETWSLESRARAVRVGYEAMKAKPLIGWGPGTATLAAYTIRSEHAELVSIEPEPPHSLPQSAIVEIGIVGFVAFFLLCICGLWKHVYVYAFSRSRLLLAFLILACTDHYLWSTWSGNALVGVMLLLGILQESTVDEMGDIT